MIKVEQLTKKYAGVTGIDQISFEVGKGEIVGFLGPNGAGKTTTMRILASYMPASSGRATVAGFDVFSESLKARRHLGYLPENVPLYHDMRVNEYLRYRGALKALSGKRLKNRIGIIKELCGLREVGRKKIAGLSKGFRQRVGLSEVEATCSRVIIINRGRIEASDTPENLVNQLRTSGLLRLEVKCASEDPVSYLSEVSGVREVSTVSDGEWRSCEIRIEANTDPREQIFRLAVQRQWVIRELSKERATLEDAFVELTHTDR